jgi:hypothetical protein
VLPAITDYQTVARITTRQETNTLLISFQTKLYSPSCGRHINYLQNLYDKNYDSIWYELFSSDPHIFLGTTNRLTWLMTVAVSSISTTYIIPDVKNTE